MTHRWTFLVFAALSLVPAVSRAADPERTWATYFGTEGYTEGYAVTVDAAGNVYVAGETLSKTTIATPGTFQPAVGTLPEAFLIKFTPDGQRVWGTYFGGDWLEYACTVAVDSAGNVAVGGYTISSGGFSTPGTLQPARLGPDDGFLVMFDDTGNRTWGTYLGGAVTLTDNDHNDVVRSVAFDADDNLYVAGNVTGPLPFALPGPHQAAFTASTAKIPAEAYLLKLAGDGSMIWGTYFGGAGDDRGYSVGLAGTEYVYLSGTTTSDDIATPGAHDTSHDGDIEDNVGYVAQLDSDGVRQWSTYFGRSGRWQQRVAVAFDGHFYIAGAAESETNFTTGGAWQTGYGGGASDGYLSRFSASGQRLWTTYIGGTDLDGLSLGTGVATDAAGNALFAMATYSTDLASTDAFQKVYGEHEDLYLARFATNGERDWATYYGGMFHEENSEGNLVVAPGLDTIYLVGRSGSPGLATPGTFGPINESSDAGLLVRFAHKNFGAPCMDSSDCVLGECVDGVCCDGPCGGGAGDDCRTCRHADGAIVDGVCTTLGPETVCRPAASTCDVPESCTGGAAECPPDEFVRDDAPCDGGVCDGGMCTGDTGTATGDISTTTDNSTTDSTSSAGTTTGTTSTTSATSPTSTAPDPDTGVPTGTESVPTDPGAPDSSGDAAADASSGGDPGTSDPGGCACALGHVPGDIPWLVAGLLALRRRRRAA